MDATDFEKIAGQLADVATKKAGIGDFFNSDAGRYLIGGGLGAGAGALLGAAQPDRAKKKRNMLYYGTLGGLGGLGLAHVLNRHNASQAASAPKPPVAPPGPPPKPEAVAKVDALPPPDQSARIRGQTEDRVIEVVNPATGKTQLVHKPDVMKETDVAPYMQTDLWRKGPQRPAGARQLAAAAGAGDFDTWVQTGNMPFYKKWTGRESTYMDRFRDRLRQYHKQTGQVAQSMEDLSRAGLGPAAANAQFPNADLNDPQTLKVLNALRGYPGALDRVQELGIQGAYQDMLRRQQEASSRMWENYGDSVGMMH